MHHRLSKWFYQITLMLLGLLLLISPAFAQQGGFEEDFEGSDLSGWELSPDTSVIDGALRLGPGNFAFKLGDWSDFKLEIQVRSEGPGEIVVLYYARDEGRYLLHILPEELILFKERGESGEVIGSASIEAIQTGDWIDLTVEVSQGNHKISIEENLLVEVTDSDLIEPGLIGFMYHGEGYAELDDLKVTGTIAPIDGSEGDPPEDNGEHEPEGEGIIAPGEQPPESGQVVEVDKEGESGGSWLDNFLASQAQPLELQTFMINLILSAILAFILGRVYIHWGTSLSNRRKFAGNFMLITITTTFIILVVRSSVALSLGLVGALSIVRFRAAIKEPEELAFLFFAIGIGIGLGDNQRLVTLLAMVVGIMIIGVVRLFHTREADVDLHLTVATGDPEKVDLQSIMSTLDSYCAKLKLLRFDETGTEMEASFLVEFRALEKLQEARIALRELSPTIEITFLDNRGIG